MEPPGIWNLVIVTRSIRDGHDTAGEDLDPAAPVRSTREAYVRVDLTLVTPVLSTRTVRPDHIWTQAVELGDLPGRTQ